MATFFNLKLKGRMLVGYAVPVVIYLGLAAMVYSTAQQVTSTFQDVERVQKVIQTDSDLALNVQGMVRSMRGYLAVQKPLFAEEYKDHLKQAREMTKTIEPLLHNAEQKQRFKRMVELIELYDHGNSETPGASDQIRLVNEGKRDDALAILRGGKVTTFVAEFDKISQTFLDSEEQILVQQLAQAKASMNNLVTALVIGSIVLIVVAIVVSTIISSNIKQTISTAINSIASSSSEIAATVEQQERTAAQQAAAVNETTTTMDELGVSSRQSAGQAEAAATGSQQVLSLVNGKGSDNVQNKSNLRDKVGEIAEQILRLSEQTSQIGNISTLVSDLANQTNMLALNAAVEAVRAGEHGKGFGVVAAEIRKLADQSKKSAERINSLVVDVQNAMNSTVMVTDEGTKTVEAIVGSVNTIALNSQQISLTAKQQAIAIQQVVEAMNAINQGAAQTASGITQAKVGTQRLNEAANNLKTVV